MNYIYYLLRGGQAVHDLLADCLFADARHEVLCDLVVDVRVEQCHANLAHSVLDILFVQLAASFQFAEDVVQLAGKSLKSHVLTPPVTDNALIQSPLRISARIPPSFSRRWSLFSCCMPLTISAA